uniref:PNPLA domain-containing protein n=1 Tax=Hucho hucho TaxID=62062 RepID=A0A4W5R9W2_9TELE
MAGQSEPVPLSISFSASGFQATYQLGVAQSMLDLAPLVLQAAPKVMGASAGSHACFSVACLEACIEMMRFALQKRGPLHPAGNVFVWLEGLLRRSLPDDAHIRASGRLAVVMTRIPDGQNTVVSEFTSREDVVQALLCSCFIPGYHGIQPPSYKGVHYVDGGLSSIQPTHSSPYAHTLTVSPFAGEADICPPDPASMYVIVMSGMPLNCSVANGYRILEALYPYNWEVGPQNTPYACQQSHNTTLTIHQLHYNGDKGCPQTVRAYIKQSQQQSQHLTTATPGFQRSLVWQRNS